jgi:hypothetical protein
MASVQDIDARIFEAEQQMALLAREIQDLKTARNALTPLGRLPDELLLYIAHAVVPPDVQDGSPVEALFLTWICGRLRTLFVCTPQLWTRIDISTHNEDRIRWCMDRASPCPLEIFVKGDLSLKAFVLLTECFPTVGILYWERMIAEAGALIGSRIMNSGVSYSKLHTITFISPSELFPIEHASFPNLTTLNIEGVDRVGVLPGLPTLRTLRLHESLYPLHVLHRFFSHAPYLESIDLGYVLRDDEAEDRAFSLSAAPVNLPHLSHLRINEVPECVVFLLHILTNPSYTMYLCLANFGTYSPDLAQEHSPEKKGGLTDRRMREFWSKLAGVAGDSFTGLAIYDAWDTNPKLQLRFEGASGAYGTCNGYAVDAENVLWANIKAVEVRSLGLEESDVEMCDFFGLRYLPSVEHVVVKGLQTATGRDVKDIRYLEDWLFNRGEQKRPLQSLVFRYCDEESRLLFGRLVERGAALSMAWKGESELGSSESGSSEWGRSTPASIADSV